MSCSHLSLLPLLSHLPTSFLAVGAYVGPMSFVAVVAVVALVSVDVISLTQDQ